MLDATGAALIGGLIGFAGAIIGAIVGGLFVQGATRRQWKRDRRDQAGRRLLDSLFQLEGVFATWLAGESLSIAEVANAFNSFSSAWTTELPFIEDDRVRTRVREHVGLCHPLLMIAKDMSSAPPKAIIEAVRRHAELVIETLQAHVSGASLPPYPPLPRTKGGIVDLDGLIAWPTGEN